jgi:hypothetical protein
LDVHAELAEKICVVEKIPRSRRSPFSPRSTTSSVLASGLFEG